jgi:hypothetical protein
VNSFGLPPPIVRENNGVGFGFAGFEPNVDAGAALEVKLLIGVGHIDDLADGVQIGFSFA